MLKLHKLEKLRIGESYVDFPFRYIRIEDKTNFYKYVVQIEYQDGEDDFWEIIGQFTLP